MITPKRFFFRAWRPSLLVLSMATIAYVLYFHNLAHLLPGYDVRELKVYSGASNWHKIISNPANAPYKLGLLLTVLLGHHSVLQARLVSASISIAIAFLFYIIVNRWHGFRTAFLATVLFATSAGFLHVARLGSAQIMQMGVLLFLAALLGYRHIKTHHTLGGYALVIGVALLAYVPGLIWIELLGLGLNYQNLGRWFKSVPRLQASMAVLLLLLLLLPLAYAGVKHPTVLRNIAGLPTQLSTLQQTPKQLGETVLAIGVRSSGDPEFYVGHAPLLDTIELVLGALGVYYYLRQKRTRRSTYLFGTTGLSLLLVAFGGNVGTALLVPLVYLFIAAGLKSLLGQWLAVFPRNPLARSLGVGLVCVMLFFSVLYQARSYFIAWPHNIATRHEFSHQQL